MENRKHLHETRLKSVRLDPVPPAPFKLQMEVSPGISGVSSFEFRFRADQKNRYGCRGPSRSYVFEDSIGEFFCNE
jgi:hypothetical protein